MRSRHQQGMWIVRLALRRPYTFVVMGLTILLLGVFAIVTTPTDDIRSYHINSDKIKRVLGYTARHTIEDAVRELTRAFIGSKIPNSMEDDRYYNVRLLKRLKAA